MRTKLGLWIDHRKALIVILSDKGEEVRLVISRLDKQLGRPGGVRSSTPFESQLVPADDSRERKFSGHLHIYYDAVMACIRHADFIMIFGPGEAKGELKAHLIKNKLGGRIVGMETIDKMTDHQIALKVRDYFKDERGKEWSRTRVNRRTKEHSSK
jgi:hypothetical protein